MKCAACGSTALVGGKLVGEDAAVVGFQPGDARWLKRILGLGNRDIGAYGCLHCRHLQLAVEFSETDLERYQQFEGEQPNVLERINSEPGDQRDEPADAQR
jgi:hypothetical protein